MARARAKYKRKETLLYVTATSNQAANIKDRTEAFLAKATNAFAGFWANLTGEASAYKSTRLREVFVNAQATYEDWTNILLQMRLTAEPLSAQEMARIQWEEFNTTPLRPLPQIAIWDGEDIRYCQSSELHVSSWLFDSQHVPKATKDYVYRDVEPGIREFTGILTLRDKPGGWRSHTDQLKYLYNKGTFLDKYKIIFTATKAPKFLVNKNIELIQRQAKDAQAAAEKRGMPSTRSQMLQEAADKASADLYGGNIPIKTSLCFLVTKTSKRDVTLACRKLQSRFLLPVSLEIERKAYGLMCGHGLGCALFAATFAGEAFAEFVEGVVETAAVIVHFGGVVDEECASIGFAADG